MELKILSPEPDISHPDDVTDPEEKEISEDDDDDRNHKHRRRITHSHSAGRFAHKQRPTLSSFSRALQGQAHKFRASQSLASEAAPGRARGSAPGFWAHHHSRISSAGIASQLVRQASVPSSLFAGRGVYNNAQSTSWTAFGMVPTLPNGGLDTIPPMGLQVTLRQSIHKGMNISIPRKRCRDFEERGFCLRGDMCPMEHGVNHIVVEDVQSLSQFNLPVSLPSAQMLGAPTSQCPLPAVNVPSVTLTSSEDLGSKISKPLMNTDGMGLNSAFADGSITAGSDLYDPDQLLWANDGPETSASLLSPSPSAVDEDESSFYMKSSGRRVGYSDGFYDEYPVKSVGAAARSRGSPVFGRIGSSKRRMEAREINSTVSASANPEAINLKSLTTAHGAARQGRHMNADDEPKVNFAHGIRKPSQKAIRTLFVNGIPQKDNNKDALLSHFQKFGEVIDIYIPLNSERAFVQFSKREEAEAALKAPDAVMGNRFIRLWWAKRDSIPDDGASGGQNVPISARRVALAPIATFPSLPGIVKDNPHFAVNKSNNAHSSSTPVSGHLTPVAPNGQKAPPPLQKKLENLEHMKEEIRKKQQMLDRKRNEFRQQLDRLEKQATGLEDEQASDRAAKRHKSVPLSDSARAETSKSSRVLPLPLRDEGSTNSSRSCQNIVSQGPILSSTVTMPKSITLRPSIRTMAPPEAPSIINRFKLDNRSTAFKILRPLPSGLANVAVLKEHFSSYGDLATVEVERLEEPEDGNNESETSLAAHICFTTRRAAENAFLKGKSWQGHDLQFKWLTSNNSTKNVSRRENLSASSRQSSDADGRPAAEAASTDTQIEASSTDNKSGETDNIQTVNLGSSSSSVSSGKLSP